MTGGTGAAHPDIFVTATGNLHVITHAHMKAMKNNAIVCNIGHFDNEIEVAALKDYKWENIKPQVDHVIFPDGKRLIVKGEDTLVKRPITIPFDMVVHAIGMDPNIDNVRIAATFGVGLESHGHIGRGLPYSRMGETSRPGVFVAGAATGPETIDDSIAQGQAAALAAQISGAKKNQIYEYLVKR